MNRLTIWTAAATGLLALVPALAAKPEGLVISLASPAPVLQGNMDVVVTVNVTNASRTPISVLRWELPTATHEGKAFRILRDGQPVAYTGRLVKRGPPQPADYLQIDPGSTLSYPVELSAGYDMSRNGRYTIEAVSKGAVGAALSAAGAASNGAALNLWLEQRTAAGPVSAGQLERALALQPAVVSYAANCSASRRTLIAQAVSSASGYASNAVSYLNRTPVATQRYTKWFGALNSTRWNTVAKHYSNIQQALASKPVNFDCSCTDSSYAYVYPNSPYKVYLCGAFWAAPLTGTDSKAGTIIHELSHFTVLGGTDDWAYGQSAAAQLAISNPARAVDNADSHEYFAENTPALP